MMEELVLILILFLAIAALIQPLFGLYGFFIIAYIRPQDFYPFLAKIEPAQWILIITAVSFLFHKLIQKKDFVKAPQNIAILGMLFVIFLSRIKAIDSQRWWQATEDFIRVTLVYFMLVNLLDTQKKLKSFYIFFILINLFVALRFYIAYRQGEAIYWGSKPGDLSYGFLANADDLGIGMVVILPFVLIPVFYAERKFIKGLCGIFSLIFMLTALATHSRGAHLGVFSVFFASILSQLRMEKIRKEKYALGLIAVIALLALFTYKYRYTLKDSYTSALNPHDSGRVGRLATWQVAKEMIKRNPLLGVGRGNYVTYWMMHYPPGPAGYQVAHNIIYEVFAEIGLLGLIFFLYFSLSGVKESIFFFRHYKEILKKNEFLEMMLVIYLISCLGFFINGMFITVAFYWHIYVLVAFYVSSRVLILKEAKVYVRKR